MIRDGPKHKNKFKKERKSHKVQLFSCANKEKGGAQNESEWKTFCPQVKFRLTR